jgi:membrane-bound acyltransferase YfiQ involved in biofilm formation
MKPQPLFALIAILFILLVGLVSMSEKENTQKQFCQKRISMPVPSFFQV